MEKDRKKLVIGICAGSTMGNSEILMREALMGAQEAGADVELIRLNDYYIKPCTGCQSCMAKLHRKGEENICIQDDDFPVIRDRILESDAIIISSPVYIQRPIASLLVLADRIGPFHDVGGLEWMGYKRLDSPIDQRLFKEKCAGFIAVGGAVRDTFLSMGLTLMNDLTFPMNIKVVDQLLVKDANAKGHVLKQEDMLKRANLLGKNVADNSYLKREEMKWCGDFEGTCPVCHGDLMNVENDKDEIICAICGIKGKVKVDNDNKIHIDFPEEEWIHSRLSKEECAYHYEEVAISLKECFGLKPMIDEKIAKYKNYDVKIVKPKNGGTEL